MKNLTKAFAVTALATLGLTSAAVAQDAAPPLDKGLCLEAQQPGTIQDVAVELTTLAMMDTRVEARGYNVSSQAAHTYAVYYLIIKADGDNVSSNAALGAATEGFTFVTALVEGDMLNLMIDNKESLTCTVSKETYAKFKPTAAPVAPQP